MTGLVTKVFVAIEIRKSWYTLSISSSIWDGMYNKNNNNNKMVLRVKKGYNQAYKSLYEPVFLAKLKWSFLQSLNFLSP